MVYIHVLEYLSLAFRWGPYRFTFQNHLWLETLLLYCEELHDFALPWLLFDWWCLNLWSLFDYL